MNGINPLKPFQEFLPNAPKWLRLTLYILRVAVFMLPAVGAPTLVSCIGSTTTIEAHVDGNTPVVTTDNNGCVALPASEGSPDQAEGQNDCVSDEYSYPAE